MRNCGFLKKVFVMVLIIFLTFQIAGCIIPSKFSRRHHQPQEKTGCIKDKKAYDAYNKLIGSWIVETRAYKKVAKKGGRIYLSPFKEHTRFYFSQNKAKMHVIKGLEGIVDLKFEGRNIRESSTYYSVLEFIFPPYEDTEKKYHELLPLLMTGKVRISIPTGRTGQSFTLLSGGHGRLVRTGSSNSYNNFYRDWAEGGHENIEEYEKKLLKTVNHLKTNGWRCIGQVDLYLNGFSPELTNLSIKSPGRKLYLIYAPYGSPYLTYNIQTPYGSPYLTHNLNQSVRQFGHYDYPTYITPNSSSNYRVFVNFDYNRSIEDITEIFPPVEIKILAFTESPFASTDSPCDYKFSTPRPKWTGFLKLFLAVIADKTQRESWAIHNQLIAEAISGISGIKRNELMASGLNDLAPDLTESQIGYIARGLIPFFEGDPVGLTISAFREKVYQEVLKGVDSIDRQTELKILDVMGDLWVAKMRGQVNER